MAKRYSQNDLPALTERQIFFDTNVIIYIFWPIGQAKYSKQYSSVLNRLLKQNNKIFVDFLVISEIVNKITRLEYNKYLTIQNLNSQNFSFKSFRNSLEGKSILAEIYQTIDSRILKLFSVTGKVFSREDIQGFLVNENRDFQDKAILALCKENKFVLFTNDKDFSNTDVDILTENPNLK